MSGGRADSKTPSDFDPKDLEHGTRHEMEHTTDRSLAQEIAMDHLAEDKDYYRKLKVVEDKKMKKTVEVNWNQLGLGATNTVDHMYDNKPKLQQESGIQFKDQNSLHDLSHHLPEAARQKGFNLTAETSPHSTHLMIRTATGKGVAVMKLHHPGGVYEPENTEDNHQIMIGNNVPDSGKHLILRSLANAAREHVGAGFFKSQLNKAGEWAGRPMVGSGHGLDESAALYEFRDGMPRHVAEEKAYRDYNNNHHLSAAAHHLQGMKAAQALGQTEEGKRHGLMYALHLRSLGMDPNGDIPKEVHAHVRSQHSEGKADYKFKPHGADKLLLNKSWSPVSLDADKILAKVDQP